MIWRPALAIFSFTLATGCASGPGSDTVRTSAAPDPELVAAGRTIAVMRCSRCHAIDTLSRSPNPDAPPIAKLMERYDDQMLANDLAEGIRIGHASMPEFVMPMNEAEAVVAYLMSIRR